jgi:hypothetical protein
VDTTEELWDECQRLNAELRTLPAWSLRADLDSILTSRRIFHGNHAELLTALRVTDSFDTWLPLIDTRNLERFAQFRDELDRLLHNYLSSAYTLSSTAYTVVAKRWAKGSAEMAAYLAEAPYSRSGLCAFMFGVRHATQHERVPFTWASWGAEQTAPGEWRHDQKFVLPLDDLRALDWSGSAVSKRGREHLDSLADAPDLRVSVEEFTGHLWRFTDWIKDQYRRLYRQEFRDFDARSHRLAQLGQPFRRATA